MLTQKYKNLVPADLLKALELENIPAPILGSASQKLLAACRKEVLKHAFDIIQPVSYTHLTELIKIEDGTKRLFYELLILKSQPTVRELKRQINSLTYERVGLSDNHKELFDEVMRKIQPQQTADPVKLHYFFEFLNIAQP